MAAAVGALRITLGANTAQFEQGMRRAQSQARATGQNISTSMQNAQRTTVTAFNNIRTVAGTLGVALGAQTLLNAGRSILRFADDLEAAAEQAGMSTTRYQTLREALRTLEIPANQVDRIFRQLQTTLGDVQNGVDDGTTQALDRLGIKARILNGEIQTSDQLLDALAGSARNAGSDAQFTSEIVAIFGQRAGPQLAAALRDGGAALRELEQQMHDTGTVIDEEMIETVAEAQETLDRFWESTKRQAVIWAAEMINAFGAARSALVDFINEAGGIEGNPVLTYSLFPFLQGAEEAAPPSAGFATSRSWMALTNPRRPPRPSARSSGRSGGGRNDAERERKERLRDEHDFQSDLRRIRMDLLREQQQQATDAAARNQLSVEILSIERQQYVADQELAVSLGDLSRTRADQLISAQEEINIERQGTLELERRRNLEAENREIDQARFEVAANALRQEADLVETAAERREVELRLLDLAHQYERAKLQELATAEGLSRVEQQRAQAALEDLDRRHGADRARVLRDTRGPMEGYLASLPTTTEQWNEALEQLAAEGLQSVTDGLADAILMTRSWGDVFKNVARQILSDLLRLQIQRNLIPLLGNALGGLGVPGFGGGTFGPSTGIASGAAAAGSFFQSFGGFRAAGGPVIPGRTYVVGENGPELLRMGSERGFITPNGQAGPSRIEIIPSPFFVAVVDGRVVKTGAPMMAAGMSEARMGAQMDLHRQARRRIP